MTSWEEPPTSTSSSPIRAHLHHHLSPTSAIEREGEKKNPPHRYLSPAFWSVGSPLTIGEGQVTVKVSPGGKLRTFERRLQLSDSLLTAATQLNIFGRPSIGRIDRLSFFYPLLRPN